ncbi:hypothetical protein BVC80_9041g2 [Macleaya cordata]|uniref:Late embryogenesis abundant protein n=1 Tax=Macleaya cordata TaxID=56857 RepID=A0A200R2S8_MACCD|nr:hypothetical protein BVC80_9041g2 [Macleaya cordata]
MNQISRSSVCKLFLKNPIGKSSRPISSFLSEPPTTISNLCSSNSVSSPKSKIFSLPISKFHSFLPQSTSNPSTHFRNHEHLRKFSGESSFDPNKEIDEINLKFAEAREEIELALESKETVYFNEEAETARDAVKIVLDKFEGLMSKLPESEKGALQRSMGLKIEQLKAELEQLNE